jgi:hypothetical protein
MKNKEISIFDKSPEQVIEMLESLGYVDHAHENDTDGIINAKDNASANANANASPIDDGKVLDGNKKDDEKKHGQETATTTAAAAASR